MVSNNPLTIKTTSQFAYVASVGLLLFAILVFNITPSSIYGHLIKSGRTGWLSDLESHANSTMIAPKNQSGGFGSNSTENLNSVPGFVSEIGSKGSLNGSEGIDLKRNSGRCDLYSGKWVYDSVVPLYTNNSCPIISPPRNCQGNGRPDKEYENWRWKPDACDLPRFDARRFLEMMRGKTIAFVGDSVARNQMESLVCILWQVEVPENRGRRRTQRWFFRSTSTWVVRIWSSWLVHRTVEAIEYAPEGMDKLHLKIPDENFMDDLPTFDVLVLSSGHWMAKRSVYVLDDRIVGWQGWRPDETRKAKMNTVAAYGITTETAVSAIATHPNYTGLTILRTYSPDHYERGGWNTGGSCTGKKEPLAKVVRNDYTDAMHREQVSAFERAVRKSRKDGAKLRLMDITSMFGYRHDGHPGPYRSTDPKKITERGPNGRPPPQDCLHWCMPGPIDTWNELLMETIKREFEESTDC